MQTEPLQESFVAMHNTWVNIESIICVCAVWFCADRSSFLESNFSLGPIKFIQTCNFLSLLFGVFPPNKQLHRVNWQVSRWFVLPIMSCTLHMWSRFNTCGVWTELRAALPLCHHVHSRVFQSGWMADVDKSQRRQRCTARVRDSGLRFYFVDTVCSSGWAAKIISCQIAWQVGQRLKLRWLVQQSNSWMSSITLPGRLALMRVGRTHTHTLY